MILEGKFNVDLMVYSCVNETGMDCCNAVVVLIGNRLSLRCHSCRWETLQKETSSENTQSQRENVSNSIRRMNEFESLI